jgi:plasmid stability protein
MASLLIRNLDDRTRGHSMEEEARAILQREFEGGKPKNLVVLAREIFGPAGVDLEAHPRVEVREPPDFGK